MENIEPKPKKTISGSKSMAISLSIAVLFLLAGYFFYVSPAQKQAEEYVIMSPEILGSELAEKKNRLISLEKRAQSYAQISPELLEVLDMSLPTEPREVDLLVNMQALAQESGVQLLAISMDSPSAVTGPKEVRPLNITLSLEGMSYSHLKRFIRNVERNIRLLQMSDVSYSPETTSYGITLTAFYYQ